MSNVYCLLNINSGVIKDFPLQAMRVDENQLNKVLNKNMRLLKQIEERMRDDKGIKVSPHSIDETISKLKRLSSKDDYSIENWSIRELRIVSYYLMKLRNNSQRLFLKYISGKI